MSTPLHSPSARRPLRRQRGVTLIEALVALLVMSFGMLALVGLMSNLRLGADVAKQRSEAMRIARAQMAELRDFSVLTRTASTPPTAYAYSDITNQAVAAPMAPVDSNTTYNVQRLVTPLPNAQGSQVRMTVSWTDRAGAPQFVNLDTVISATDPIFSAAVGFRPPAGAVTQPSARSPVIPPGAKQLDRQVSAFIPSNTADKVWVFNNVTGVITGKCSITPGTAVSTLTAADVDSCKNNTIGYLLSGTVRFSNVNPPNPAVPEAFAIPLDLSIVSGSYSLPHLDPQGVPVISGGNMVLDSFTDTAPSFDCFNDSPAAAPSTQAFVTYNCIVYPDSTTKLWSGRLQLTGFSTGTTAAEYKVCRYSADYNGSHGMFTGDWKGIENEEHPAVYGRVAGSLARQNFLVVRGNLSCPTAPAVDLNAGVFADYSTLQLQP